MLGILNFILLINVQIIFVQCLIPGLTVRKLDRKIIQRKRQDTFEMCRIFNSENERLKEFNKPKPVLIQSRNLYKRLKRSAGFENHTLNADDVNIVEKIGDDIDENGDKVTYKQKDLNKLNTTPLPKSGRRFNFAPASLLGPDDKESSKHHSDDIRIPWQKKWKHGIIPYFIDSNTYDSHLAEIIGKAFDYFEKATCVRLQRLRERPTDQQSLQKVEWVYVSNPMGIRQCVHSNERKPNKGVQMAVFGYDCMSLGEIVHEVMHILGFSHEHTRPDRDKHISILWDNIKPGYMKYFELHKEDRLMTLPYDYASVLHYPQRAFSKNGQITLKVEPGIKLGQREGLSAVDIQKVSMIYGVECLDRNKQYLQTTCPSVMTSKEETKNVPQEEIEKYFKPRIWPYAIVNYRIKDKMEFSSEERENINTVIRHIEKETCIEFRDFTDDINEDHDDPHHANEQNNADYNAKGRKKRGLKPVPATPPTPSRRHAANTLILTRSALPGCKCPQPGRPDGHKMLEISSGCFNSVNDLLHLFVHVLGLDHQHNMHDRDSYLHIVWDKLTPEVKEEMQQKLPPAAAMAFPYDYQSVMHYPWLEIKNGVTNIMYPIWNDGWAMGHWQGLSSTDVHKLSLIYAEECMKRKKYANLSNR